MKRCPAPTLLFCACLFAPLSAAAAASVSPTPDGQKVVSPDSPERIRVAADLHLRRIGDGVFVVTHTFPWPANLVLVEMADKTLVLADTPNTPEATRALLDWIAKRFGKRPVVAINTGYHPDNSGGNQALLAAGVPVYGSDLTAALIRERGEQIRQAMLRDIGDPKTPAYAAQLQMSYLPPDHTFPINEGLALSFGGDEVQVIYPDPSQSSDKVAVYFPLRKLLFGSCMIIGWDKIGNTADADLEHWPAAVRQLRSLDVRVIVPGHGNRLDTALIEHTLRLLRSAPLKKHR